MPSATPERLFKPVDNRRASAEVVEQVVEAIDAGDLVVGSALPPERALALQLGISRPTLRQGVRALAEAGVLRVSSGRLGGTTVASESIPSTLAPRRQPNAAEVGAVLEARRLLEPRVAQLAALYATDDDLATMERIVEAARLAVSNPERFEQLEHRFHVVMARATHNPTLIQLMRALLRDLRAAEPLITTEEHEPRWALEVHQRTLAALRSGDADAVERVMSHHLSLLEASWQEVTGKPRLRKVPGFLLA